MVHSLIWQALLTIHRSVINFLENKDHFSHLGLYKDCCRRTELSTLLVDIQ